MKRNFTRKVDNILRNLLDGKIYSPIEENGIGEERRILQQLEAVRKALVDAKDSECETAEKNNTSIASVAHDLKTPLAVISGYAECIQDGIDDKDYASLIISKAAQMNDTVLSIVESSKRESQKNSSERKKVNAREFFSTETAKYFSLAAARKVTLKISKRIPDVYLRINVQDVARAVQNLITNAVKYTPEGGFVKVSFSFRSGKLIFKVKDNGIGIGKEKQKLVFDKFYRADESRTDTNSSGLGLYITKEIALAHGGDVSVSSKENEGSVFTLRLPVEQSRRKGLANRFDTLPKAAQLLIYCVLGMFLPWIYRFSRYNSTKNLKTLAGAAVCIILFPFVLMPDIMSIIMFGKITFMAD